MTIISIDIRVGDLPDAELPDIAELSGDLRLLAEKVGVRTAMLVAEEFGGTMVSLAGYVSWKRRVRDRRIRGEYDDGASVIALARKYGLSLRYVKNILYATDGAAAGKRQGKQLTLW